MNVQPQLSMDNAAFLNWVQGRQERRGFAILPSGAKVRLFLQAENDYNRLPRRGSPA
jgi:hypothetical protein